MTNYRTHAPTVLLAIALAAAIAMVGAHSARGHTVSAKKPAAVVTLKNIQFHPAVSHIKVGQSVEWKWEDADIDTQHNVTSIGKQHFKSSKTQEKGTYTVTFNTAGTYDFECTIHPQSMQGKVIVTK
jgi:plastocyanin